MLGWTKLFTCYDRFETFCTRLVNSARSVGASTVSRELCQCLPLAALVPIL
jgi:hypothetical protein